MATQIQVVNRKTGRVGSRIDVTDWPDDKVDEKFNRWTNMVDEKNFDVVLTEVDK